MTNYANQNGGSFQVAPLAGGHSLAAFLLSRAASETITWKSFVPPASSEFSSSLKFAQVGQCLTARAKASRVLLVRPCIRVTKASRSMVKHHPRSAAWYLFPSAYCLLPGVTPVSHVTSCF